MKINKKHTETQSKKERLKRKNSWEVDLLVFCVLIVIFTVLWSWYIGNLSDFTISQWIRSAIPPVSFEIFLTVVAYLFINWIRKRNSTEIQQEKKIKIEG